MTTRRVLLARGYSARSITVMVESGRLIRIRRGWYGVPQAPADLITAVRLGGRLGCVSALSWHGVWTMHKRVHVCIPHGLHRTGGNTFHWRTAPPITPDTAVEDPATAFECFVSCGSDLDIIVAADSALHTAVLTNTEVTRILSRTRRGRRLLQRVDGRAESGTETVMRLIIRGARIPVRVQVEIAGVGRVDLMIGDRLVIEVDSRKWHDNESAFESDRRRDARLAALGYLVLRFTYRRIMEDREHLLDEISRIVAHGEHRWRRRDDRKHGRNGLPAAD